VDAAVSAIVSTLSMLSWGNAFRRNLLVSLVIPSLSSMRRLLVQFATPQAAETLTEQLISQIQVILD